MTDTVIVAGVDVADKEALNQEALLVTPRVVDAPPALTLTVWAAGLLPGVALNTRLEGDGLRVTALCTAETWIFE